MFSNNDNKQDTINYWQELTNILCYPGGPQSIFSFGIRSTSTCEKLFFFVVNAKVINYNINIIDYILTFLSTTNEKGVRVCNGLERVEGPMRYIDAKVKSIKTKYNATRSEYSSLLSKIDNLNIPDKCNEHVVSILNETTDSSLSLYDNFRHIIEQFSGRSTINPKIFNKSDSHLLDLRDETKNQMNFLNNKLRTIYEQIKRNLLEMKAITLRMKVVEYTIKLINITRKKIDMQKNIQKYYQEKIERRIENAKNKHYLSSAEHSKLKREFKKKYKKENIERKFFNYESDPKFETLLNCKELFELFVESIELSKYPKILTDKIQSILLSWDTLVCYNDNLNINKKDVDYAIYHIRHVLNVFEKIDAYNKRSECNARLKEDRHKQYEEKKQRIAKNTKDCIYLPKANVNTVYEIVRPVMLNHYAANK